MLSTKDIKATGPGKISKTIKPGNITAKILDITLQPLKNDPNGMYLILHLEGEDQGPEFEGFMYDKDNPNKGRAKGQVGKVRYSAYPYKDGFTKAGRPKDRDMDILRSLVELSVVADKRDEMNAIQEKTIENFVKSAAKLLADGTFYYWCIGGAAYMKDDGNKDFSLHLPKYDKNFVNFEVVGTTPSKVAVFDYTKHVDDKTNEGSTPAKEESKGWGETPATQEGTWKPTSFNI
jgi:hypothetical protein